MKKIKLTQLYQTLRRTAQLTVSPFSNLSAIGRTQEEKEEKQQLESEAGTFPTQLWNWAKSRRKTGIKETIRLASWSQIPRYELLMSNPATGTRENTSPGSKTPAMSH